jgi:hypothetical protein
MRHSTLLTVGFVVAIVATAQTGAAQQPPLEKVRTIPMPGVEGRIDHMAVDIERHRLFVAALGNNTLEVLDLERGNRLHTIIGLREPQGVAYLSRAGRIVVANGKDGSCRFFDGQTYQPIAQIDCGEDADNVRYDEHGDRIYIGYGQGALAEIDPVKLARVADIQLPGHPESFQLESKGSRIFVNVPSAREVDVIDREKALLVARWPMEAFQANFPMALDEANHRLLVGCRKPARLVVCDTRSGKLIASLPCVGDTDDVFYDGRLHRVYVSGGEGSVSVFQQADADHYNLLATAPTAPGARTSLFVPATNRLYIAVPHRNKQQAEIWEYKAPETSQTRRASRPG